MTIVGFFQEKRRLKRGTLTSKNVEQKENIRREQFQQRQTLSSRVLPVNFQLARKFSETEVLDIFWLIFFPFL